MNPHNEGAASGRGIAFIQVLLSSIIWGLIPLYFHMLNYLPAIEIVSFRIFWLVPIMSIIILLRGGFRPVFDNLKPSGNLKWMIASAIFIGGNWLIYTIAIIQGQVLAASIGYFLNPLLNIALARLILNERLDKLQTIAVFIAAFGVIILAFTALKTLWLSLGLASFWSFYVLTRKVAPVRPMVGLTSEALLLFPLASLAIGYFAYSGTIHGFGGDDASGWTTDMLLLGGGVLTAVPLLLYTSAAKKLRVTTISLAQYIAPTMQFLLAVFVFKEEITLAYLICCVSIWIGLILYSYSSLRAASVVEVAQH